MLCSSLKEALTELSFASFRRFSLSLTDLPELQGCKINFADLGGTSLICTADEDAASRGPFEATMNIVFGQGVLNYELGLGAGVPKGSTKPIRCETLDGIAILDIAAGQNTTFCELRDSFNGK